MMKKYFKQELIYGINSNIYYIITILLVILFGITLYFNYSSVNSTHGEYLMTIDYYETNNLDIEEDLAGESNVQNTEKGELIENPILYYRDAVSRYLYAASPKYTISQLLESSTLYFPIVFGLLGLLIATNDFKYKTIKLKTVRMEKKDFVIAKQLSLAFSSFFILISGLTFSYIVGWIMYSQITSNISVSDFIFEPPTDGSSIITKFAFGYVIALVFAQLGYAFGTIFKNMYVGLIAIIIYMFIIPNLAGFDLKNAIFYIAKNIFDFYGVISIESPKDTSLMASIIVLLLVFIVSCIANILVLKKRSSFES